MRMPFLTILPVVVIGILAENLLLLPIWITAPLCVAAIIAAVIRLRKKPSSTFTLLALLFFAMTITNARFTRDIMPKNSNAVMTLQITDTPVASGRWTRATATVGEFRAISATSFGHGTSTKRNGNTTPKAESDLKAARDITDTFKNHQTYDATGWKRSGEKVVVRFDSVHKVSVGDRIIATGRTSALGSEEYESYTNLMRRRGYSAAVWINANEQIITLPEKAKTPAYYSARLQSAAIGRLERLSLSQNSLDVCKAMATGSRNGMLSATKEAYSQTGTSHLLAVSGMHIGIVALLINLLLYPLPAIRRGHIIRNIIALAAIWVYVFLTGLSPSAIRAAMMFSGAQIALASSQRYSGLNIMLGTATIMLLLNPNYLYDISFQLSFIAVLGIGLFYGPLFGVVRSKHKFLNAIWSIIIVGITASAATMPLVAYYFSRISLIGIIINPVIIFTATVVVLFSLLWIIAPIDFLGGAFSFILETTAGWQNSLITLCASEGWLSTTAHVNGWQVAVAYTAIAIVYLLIVYYRKKQHEK